MTRAHLDANCGLAKLRNQRHRDGRDLKLIITQRDSETGGGKTTLAVFLALSWDPHGWDGEEKGTVSAEEFLETYPELPLHSALVMDEAEELDARRSMASENVQFSKDWMMMRTRQIDSILTLPTTSALDKRLLELADVRINVIARGEANVYRIKIDDHNPQRGAQQWFMHEIQWPDMTPHPEYQKLDAQKQAKINREQESKRDADEEPSKSDLKKVIRQEAKRRRRNGETIREICRNIPDNPDTNASYSTETVHRWVRDIQQADTDSEEGAA